ncbi:MAG: hypothetical protein HY081_04550 [Gammaproteobacteria bacterium]|nr:hypothetical protein [Gammaproteobacteria bacterium]
MIFIRFAAHVKHRASGLLCVLMLLTSSAFAEMESDKPTDPFDYSYCGGKPMYPVIGYNFATACGPRNQIALGRRGLLMWLFPDKDGKTIWHRGSRSLSETELKHLMLLAEVTQFSDATVKSQGPVLYDMGIDFSGRPYMRLHAAFTDAYTPANELFRALLSLVPDTALLPDCDKSTEDFSPTLNPNKRLTHTSGLPEEHAAVVH